MESLKALDTYDAKLRIRKHIEKSGQNSNTYERAELSLPARLCSESLELFRKILQSVIEANGQDIPRSEHIGLERSFCQLKLW
jgi:hypothetical protein